MCRHVQCIHTYCSDAVQAGHWACVMLFPEVELNNGTGFPSPCNIGIVNTGLGTARTIPQEKSKLVASRQAPARTDESSFPALAMVKMGWREFADRLYPTSNARILPRWMQKWTMMTGEQNISRW